MGSTVVSFCVDSKFKSKEELTQNEFSVITPEVWNVKVSNVDKHRVCYHGKKYKANPLDSNDPFINSFECDLTKGDPLSTHHLVAVMSYCDFTDLQYAFSEPF